MLVRFEFFKMFSNGAQRTREEMEKSVVRNLDSSFGINVCKEFQDVKSSGRGSVETLLRKDERF